MSNKQQVAYGMKETLNLEIEVLGQKGNQKQLEQIVSQLEWVQLNKQGE